MVRIVWRSHRALLTAALMIGMFPVPGAWAQQSFERITAGVTVGIAGNGNSWSGGGPGPLVTAHVDLPINRQRLRFDCGTTTWSPGNEPLNDVRAGRIWMSHVGATVLGYSELGNELAVYGGVGVGRYLFHAEHGTLSKPSTMGLHLLGGMERISEDSKRGYHVELGIGGVGGPGHGQVWAYTLPTLSASAGVSWRF